MNEDETRTPNGVEHLMALVQPHFGCGKTVMQLSAGFASGYPQVSPSGLAHQNNLIAFC